MIPFLWNDYGSQKIDVVVLVLLSGCRFICSSRKSFWIRFVSERDVEQWWGRPWRCGNFWSKTIFRWAEVRTAAATGEDQSQAWSEKCIHRAPIREWVEKWSCEVLIRVLWIKMSKTKINCFSGKKKNKNKKYIFMVHTYTRKKKLTNTSTINETK